MRVQKGEQIGGVPFLKIRDYVKGLQQSTITKEWLEDFFWLQGRDLDSFIEAIFQCNFIEAIDGQADKYQLTINGQSLGAARCVAPMSKEKADKIFSDFMQRVEEINKDDYYLYRVEKLYLFGSYLNSSGTDYWDIDIAFRLARRISDDEEFHKANQARIEEAGGNGKNFSNILDMYVYPRTEVIQKLKNRCQYISLHEMEDGILKIAKYKQIYPTT